MVGVTIQDSGFDYQYLDTKCQFLVDGAEEECEEQAVAKAWWAIDGDKEMLVCKKHLAQIQRAEGGNNPLQESMSAALRDLAKKEDEATMKKLHYLCDYCHKIVSINNGCALPFDPVFDPLIHGPRGVAKIIQMPSLLVCKSHLADPLERQGVELLYNGIKQTPKII